MINLQDYIDNKLEEIDYEFQISHEHMTKEADIVRDFLDDAFDGVNSEFNRYGVENLDDLAHQFGEETYKDYTYAGLEQWLTSPDHDGAYHFEKVIQEGLVRTDSNFDFHTTIQAAQVHEATDAIQFAHDSELLTPVIAAMYMQSLGYERVNEELLDRMADMIDTDELSRSGLEDVLREAKAEQGLSDREVGEKSKGDKKKDRGVER